MNNTVLSTFGDELSVCVIGASGGLGHAFINHFIDEPKIKTIVAFSRTLVDFTHPKIQAFKIDIESEANIKEAFDTLDPNLNFDIVIVATGILHGESIAPEKSLRDLSMSQLMDVFSVNTFGPAIIAKYCLPRMQRNSKNVFVCLSARVGSISDNRLGGWYAYRSSKAALNMILKNAAIETTRRNKHACVIGLHPGTVDTPLSKPFQSQVKTGKLFTTDQSCMALLNVINTITPEQTGKVFAWDGSEVPA